MYNHSSKNREMTRSENAPFDVKQLNVRTRDEPTDDEGGSTEISPATRKSNGSLPTLPRHYGGGLPTLPKRGPQAASSYLAGLGAGAGVGSSTKLPPPLEINSGIRASGLSLPQISPGRGGVGANFSESTIGRPHRLPGLKAIDTSSVGRIRPVEKGDTTNYDDDTPTPIQARIGGHYSSTVKKSPSVGTSLRMPKKVPKKIQIHTANSLSHSDEETKVHNSSEASPVVSATIGNHTKNARNGTLAPVNKPVSLRQAMISEFRHCAMNPTVPRKVLEEHLTGILRSLLYVKTCLRPPSPSVVAAKKLRVVPEVPEKPKTVVLDLDETLVYVDKGHVSSGNGGNGNRVIRLQANTADALRKICKTRPYLQEFLTSVGEHFEIMVFTASSEDYAKLVVEIIDPEKKYIKNILSREQCLETRLGVTIKDMRIIQNRELKNMVLVDNLAHCFGFQVANGIPIVEWRGDKKDCELKYLSHHLIAMKDVDDFQAANRDFFKLEQLVEKYAEVMM